VRQYDDLFRLVQGADAALLCRVLDQAEAAEAAAGAPLRRSLAGVSEALLAHASKVLYLRLDGSLTFQPGNDRISVATVIGYCANIQWWAIWLTCTADHRCYQ
jgi:hypothetical protein